ncbi:hypothetical protein PsorP6_011083 [Peronosclerospora sorghi]|uniref:Uncharacterized protein n=1 Tax=Peronosclerospora sorghi TaxID=230839 RepID=A0ACC0VUC0_9STRA|nr:hypothetical protein PsorP6_011083 [Peronosclerospora sorghi]
MTTTEFVEDDEEMEDVEHALAAADERQIMNQPRADAHEIKDEDDEEPEFKSDVKASVMEIDEVEEEKSKELNDTHRAEKTERRDLSRRNEGCKSKRRRRSSYDKSRGNCTALSGEIEGTYRSLSRRKSQSHTDLSASARGQKIKPQLFKLRELTSYSLKKIAKEEAAQKPLTKRQEQKLTEVEELNKDHARLDIAKAELNTNQRLASQENEDGAFVLEGSCLEEYHLIKEAAQLKKNILQQAAVKNEVDILTQDHAENQKMISMLTDDLKQTMNILVPWNERLSTLIMIWLTLKRVCREWMKKVKIKLLRRNANGTINAREQQVAWFKR